MMKKIQEAFNKANIKSFIMHETMLQLSTTLEIMQREKLEKKDLCVFIFSIFFVIIL
jgi:hypothetical protein